MRGTHSFLLDEENIDFEIDPNTFYNSPVLAVKQGNQSIQLHLSNTQLAELEFVIRTHLDSLKYPQAVEASTKEEIA